MNRSEPSADAEEGVFYPLAICVLVVGLLLGVALLPRLFKPSEPAFVGKASPEFSVPLVANADNAPKAADGSTPTTISISGLKGKAVILDFWATWCGPCNAEAPILDQVAKKYADRGLVVVGVSQDDSPELPREWVKSRKVSYPLAFDSEGVSRNFNVESLPTMVVLDKAGVVRAIRIGMTPSSEIQDIVEKLL
ncbi:MAG: TlpA disulfide reductase family protein [Polyangiaceae bacterium]